MKLLIAGSYGVSISVQELDAIIKRKFEIQNITEVICDTRMERLGRNWANANGINVNTLIQKRNEQLGDYADEALILHNGNFGPGGIVDYMTK